MFKLTADYVTVTMRNDSKNYDLIPLTINYCQKENFNPELHDKFDELSLRKAFCINASNSVIYGQYESRVFNYIRIRLRQCSNTSNQICMSEENIEKELPLWRMSFYYTFDLENTNNYLSPQVNVISNYGFTLSHDTYKRTNFFFQNNTLITDDNYWLENHKSASKSLISYDTKYDEFQQNSPSSTIFFAGVFIRVSPIKYVFQRIYKKVPNIFAEVVGMLNYSFYILFIFFYFYNTFLLKINLFNYYELFNLKPGNKDSYPNELLKSFTSLKRNNIINTFEHEDSNSDLLKNSIISISKEERRKPAKLNSCLIMNNYLICCKCHKRDHINLYKIYSDLNDKIIERLDVFKYISLQNKFYFLCKFILDDDQHLLFNSFNNPFLFIDLNNSVITEDICNNVSKEVLDDTYKRILSKKNKSKIDNILLVFKKE